MSENEYNTIMSTLEWKKYNVLLNSREAVK